MAYQKLKVKIKLTTDMLGTVAKDPEIYKNFIESKKSKSKSIPADPEIMKENESETVEQAEIAGWTGFHKDENGLFLYEYLIKGHLKEAGNVLKDNLKVKALRSKIDDYVFISPRRIYLGQQDPDDVFERPIIGMTAQGQRVSLRRSDLIRAGKEIEYEITMIPHEKINRGLIESLLQHGELMGLGQFRNGGFGRFQVLEVSEVTQ